MITWTPDLADSSDAARGPVATATVVDTAQAIADMMPEWQALADRVATAGVFMQPAVWQSWWRTIGQGRSAPIICVREAGRVIGVMPVMRHLAWRGPTLGVRYDYDPADGRWLQDTPRRWVPVRQISPVLSLPATMLGPALLAQPARRTVVIGAVADCMVRLRGWDVGVIPVDDAEAAVWQHAFAAAGARSAVQGLNRTDFSLAQVARVDVLMAAQSQKARANLRRAEAAADRAGLVITVARGVALGPFAHLAEESWKAQGRRGQDVTVPYAGAQRAFFEALVAGNLPCVTATVMQGCVPVAMTLGITHGRTLTTLLTFWNGCEKQASPGLLCMGALVDWAVQNGMARVDFNTNSPWLRHLTDTVALQQNLLVFAPTWRGRMLAGLRAASVALRDRYQGAGA